MNINRVPPSSVATRSRLHEHQSRAAEFGGDAVDVTAQDRRQVGIDHRGVATAD